MHTTNRPAGGGAVVETSGLEAVFPTGDGVGPVDLSVRPGESVLLLGPSGSGKSTLLRMLHGAVPQAVHATVTGTARIAGRPVAEVRFAELAGTVGVVAQDPESGVCLSEVADEVAFPLENLAVDPAAIGAAVELALDRVGAAGLRGRGTTELSGGELQRVALAAAIAPQPLLLLLDEPTAMLDADGIHSVRHAISAARRATGAACVLVEHRLDELAGDDGVAGLPERWIVLGRDGRVRHDVPADGLPPAAVRDLVAQGCWLPAGMELRALLGGGVGAAMDVPADDAGLAAALRALARDADPRHHPAAPAPAGAPAGSPTTTAADSPTTTPAPAGAATQSPSTTPPPTGAATQSPTTTPPPAAASPTLRARGLVVDRGGRSRRRPVLRGIDLDLRTGETSALVGANGSGKSTLLASLAGLERPVAGSVVGPRPGLVFQNPEHQFAASTVRAELAHGLPAGAVGRVGAMLRRFDLTGIADRNPYRLSGGQKRRVSLAAMLLHDRPFLLADEPTFGLDRHAAIGAMRALRDAARAGRGVLFSSHDLRAVVGHADRVIVLGGGRLLADTTPLRLLRDPGLLAAARLRPPRLARWIAEQAADDAEARLMLRALDDMALRLRVESIAEPVG